MTTKNTVDADALREQVRIKYGEVAQSPGNEFHFHTGRPLALKLGYSEADLSGLSEQAIESFAGVGNPFSLRSPSPGEKIVDAGSGAGFDCFIAANTVGNDGWVIGVDMTDDMLVKAKSSASQMQLGNVEFRKGLLEKLPVEDEWADTVISNGVINLCADKSQVLAEIYRVTKPGGYLQFADIANAKPVPQAALDDIDLWTA